MPSSLKRFLWSVGILLAVAAAVWIFDLDLGSGEPAANDPASAETTAAPSDEPQPEPEPEPAPANQDVWEVVEVFDGDTIVVARGNVEETVRIIGIDTPEYGKCGYQDASYATQSLIGEDVNLVAGADDNRDVHDRLLRYVEIDGDDWGLIMIEDGLAIAKYDSRTGQPHDREQQYWLAHDDAERACPLSAWDRN